MRGHRPRRTFDRMSSQSQTRAGLACIAGASIGVLAGVVTLVVQGSTSVSDEVWGYPWEEAALVAMSLPWVLSHLLIVPAILWLRSPAGAKLALAGTVLLAIAELASIPVYGQQLSETGPSVVAALFALATLLLAGGFLVVGAKATGTPEWTGWKRYTPLAVGLCALAVTGLAMTPLAYVGIAVANLCIAAFGLALLPAGEARPQARPAG